MRFFNLFFEVKGQMFKGQKNKARTEHNRNGGSSSSMIRVTEASTCNELIASIDQIQDWSETISHPCHSWQRFWENPYPRVLSLRRSNMRIVKISYTSKTWSLQMMKPINNLNAPKSCSKARVAKPMNNVPIFNYILSCAEKSALRGNSELLEDSGIISM